MPAEAETCTNGNASSIILRGEGGAEGVPCPINVVIE